MANINVTVQDGTPINVSVGDTTVLQLDETVAENVSFTQSGTGAVGRTVQAKLRDTVSPKDFGAVADGVADDTAAINAALATGRSVDFGGLENVYRVTSTFLITANDRIMFGSGATIRSDHTARGYVVPIIRVTGARFRSWGIKWDHNASGVAGPVVANQVAIAFGDGVMLGGDEFDFTGVLLNTWVNGVGVGSFTVTGTGAAGSPLNATQTVGEPKNWRLRAIYGEGCGIGVQNYTAFGELGRKGGVVNILTASDGVIESVTGKDNYNGLIVDFAGGAECSIGPCAFSNTLRDADQPNNGSGITYYLGSGGIIAPALKSDGAGRFGLVVTETAGEIVLGAQLHDNAESGMVISGGSVTGSVCVSAAGRETNNTFDAIVIDAATANIQVNLQATVRAAASGNTYRRAYTSQHTGAFRVRGLVSLVADAGATATFSRGSLEVFNLSGAQSQENYGVVSFGTGTLLDTTSRMFVGGDITLSNSTPVFAARLVFDLVDNRWEHLDNGYGFILRQDSTTGTITLQKSGNNASGPGAAATLTTVDTW
jgi:hypothetical protein